MQVLKSNGNLSVSVRHPRTNYNIRSSETTELFASRLVFEYKIFSPYENTRTSSFNIKRLTTTITFRVPVTTATHEAQGLQNSRRCQFFSTTKFHSFPYYDNNGTVAQVLINITE